MKRRHLTELPLTRHLCHKLPCQLHRAQPGWQPDCQAHGIGPGPRLKKVGRQADVYECDYKRHHKAHDCSHYDAKENLRVFPVYPHNSHMRVSYKRLNIKSKYERGVGDALPLHGTVFDGFQVKFNKIIIDANHICSSY
jgi:hypothetical protein